MPKEYLHRGQTFILNLTENDRIQISLRGTTGSVVVKRNSSPKFPYCYTYPEKQPINGTTTDVPARDLTDAARQCCEALMEYCQITGSDTGLDRRKAAEALREWYEAV